MCYAEPHVARHYHVIPMIDIGNVGIPGAMDILVYQLLLSRNPVVSPFTRQFNVIVVIVRSIAINIWLHGRQAADLDLQNRDC